MIAVSGLRVYPVKSLGGIEVDAAEVDEFGLRFDRRWMVVDAAGRFQTQRWRPRMALVRPQLDKGSLRLVAPGMPDVNVPAGGGPSLLVQVWKHMCSAEVCGDEAAAWMSEFLGEPCNIVYMSDTTVRYVNRGRNESIGRVGFADAYPFLAISEASLSGLNERLASPVPMNRFRPNIIASGLPPHGEDAWDRVRIGEIEMVLTKPCDRCVTTTVDQDTGRAGTEPLRTLATYRRLGPEVVFGVYLAHRSTGVLRVGDTIVPQPA